MSSTALSSLRWVSIAWCALGIALACGEKGNEDLFGEMPNRGGNGRGGNTSGGSNSNANGGVGASLIGGSSAGGSGASAGGSGGRSQSAGGSAAASPAGGSGGALGGRSSGGSGEAGMVPNGGGGVAGSTGGVSGGGTAGSESGGASPSEGGATNGAGSAGDASAGAAGDGAAPRTIQIGVLDDAYVDSCETERNTGSDETLSVDSDPCVFAVFVKPAALSEIPPGATVESALLELQCTDAGNAVRVLRITDDWSEESVTWDSSPGVGDEIGSFEPLEGPVFIDITELVTEWLAGAPIHGVALVQTEETDGSDYPSTEAGEANAPRLVVTYTP